MGGIPRDGALRRLALTGLAAAAVAAPAVATPIVASAATTQPTTESYQSLLHQIDTGQVSAAVINRKAHTAKVTLASGSIERVDYPPKQEKQLSDTLRKKGANVKIAKRKRAKKAVHHKLRYIAAAIVGLGILVGGVLLIVRGRRPPAGSERDDRRAAAADAGPGEPPAPRA